MPLSNHELLVLWVELASLLFAARLLGALSRRLGQPAVVGELIAGLLLGPSVFGHVWHSGFQWFLPAGRDSQPLTTASAISLLFLLVVIGAETDLRLIRSLGRAAASVSAVSFAVPMAAGAAVAIALPSSLIGPKGGKAVFVLLMAAAAAVSSLPVIAKIVSDMGLVRRNVGQLAIAGGSTNDAVGFLILAVATGLVGGGQSNVAVALVGLLGITVLLLTVGQRVFDALLRQARKEGPNVGAALGICAIGSLVAAAAMQAVGVEGALGAFAAGVALGRSRFQHGQALKLLNTMTATIFSPLYFSTAGLRVDVGALGRSGVAVSFLALTGVALVAKFVGAAAGAWGARLHRREAVAMGIALNGRGALQVIIGTAGLTMGALDTSSYTVVILMSLVSSILVPPLLRAVVGRWEGSAEEQERLGREEEMGRNIIVRGHRILLPSRGSPNSTAAAAVIDAVWPEESEVTVLSITPADGAAPPDVAPVLSALEGRSVDQRRASSENVLEEIVAEAQLGYGAVVLGAVDDPGEHHLLSPVLDDLLVESPIPLLVVRGARGKRAKPSFDRIVVGVSGTAASRAAQEVAFNLGRAHGTEVVLTHIVTRGDVDAGDVDADDALVVRGALSMASEMGVDPQRKVRHGRSAGKEIVRVVRESGADAVALGTTVRQVDGQPFLGHTVEEVLAQTDAAVIVVVLPEVSERLGALVAEASGQA